MKKSLLNILLTVYLAFLASLLVLAGVGFMIAALFLYLCRFLEPWAAGLTTGAILLGAVLLLLLLVWVAYRLQHKAETRSPPPTPDPGSEWAGLFQELLKNSNLRGRDLSLYALVAGGMLGASPELRRLLISIISEVGKPRPEAGPGEL